MLAARNEYYTVGSFAHPRDMLIKFREIQSAVRVSCAFQARYLSAEMRDHLRIFEIIRRVWHDPITDKIARVSRISVAMSVFPLERGEISAPTVEPNEGHVELNEGHVLFAVSLSFRPWRNQR